MSSSSCIHTATLPANVQVSVAVGLNEIDGRPLILSSAELYDPVAETWTATGDLGTARVYDTATLLPNGKVLVAAGNNSFNFLSSAELYDPATGTWTYTGNLTFAR